MKDTIRTIQEKEADVLAEFVVFEDWMDRYAYIIELGKSLPEIESKYKTEQYLIKGCQSQVWLNAAISDGKVFYSADSDALITKGIAGLLIQVLNGSTPDEILGYDFRFIDAIGLKEHLSPTRTNGLLSMVKQMKLFLLNLNDLTDI